MRGIWSERTCFIEQTPAGRGLPEFAFSRKGIREKRHLTAPAPCGSIRAVIPSMRRRAHHFAQQNIICVSRHHAAGTSFQKNPQQTQKPAWQRVFVYRGVGKYIKLGIAFSVQRPGVPVFSQHPCCLYPAICIIRFFLFLSNNFFGVCFNLALYISMKTLYN